MDKIKALWFWLFENFQNHTTYGSSSLKIFRITETGGWSSIIFSKSKEPQFWDFENFQGSSSSHERISKEHAV
jgi:hypothetical protein